MAQSAKAKFLELVSKIALGKTARSENDLSANLAAYIGSLNLHTVVDTSSGSGGRKRPDIRAYLSAENADLVLPAEIVIESKKPQEVKEFPNLRTAMVSEVMWSDKTFPYIIENIERIRYYALTTFVTFAIVEISGELRNAFAKLKTEGGNDGAIRKAIFEAAVEFDLTSSGSSDPKSSEAWDAWCRSHIVPEKLDRLPLSQIRDISPVLTPVDLEIFAARLAGLAAGAADDRLQDAGLFYSIRATLHDDYEGLPGDVRRDLQIFLMTQHPGADLQAVEAQAREHLSDSLDEFVAASIHSLIGRLFAYKSIEDKFCVGVKPPLIEEPLWVFHTDSHDGLSDGDLRNSFAKALHNLKAAHNPAIQRLATNGVFYDWILSRIDATLFRNLVELFASHSFADLKGDLLGRFFELYAQDVNRTKRQKLGQYYTPLPIVSAMWALALKLVTERGALDDLHVLDPGAGSGTFLVEGVRALCSAGQNKFWERLTGFDISIQAVGIAYVNVFVAVLGLLTREHADDVTDLSIYATDALDPRNGKYLRSILPLVVDEDYKRLIEQRVQLSEQIKKEGRFTLIIGNPPYRNNSARTLAQISEVFPRLLATSRANARAQERNARDDYAWFLAASDYYVGGKGIIAFIVSDSFCHLTSYKYFRGDLLRHYHVRALIRLGGTVFQDVGPRISFVVILLEKRSDILDTPDDTSTIPYIDLRPLVSESPHDILATVEDPRLILLDEFSKGKATLPNPVAHKPSSDLGFSFYPAGEVIDRVRSASVPLYEKKKPRIFLEKWPGIITAFDDLLKSDDREVLRARIAELFSLAGRRSLTGTALDRQVATWGKENGISEAQFERLRSLIDQIRGSKLGFDANKIKRALDGSAPNSHRWYPRADNRVFIYFEPSFRFGRNVNEGKAVGWGDMQQWREPTSHQISPKLVFTTGTKPNYGLKAFVLHDEWYIKLHGGTSQQYHYTGLVDASKSLRTDGVPNNLADSGAEIAGVFSNEGLPEEALLFYVAAIYNSDLAAEYIEQQGDSKQFGIKIPKGSKQIKLATEIASIGKMLRNLHWAFELTSELSIFDAALLDSLFPAAMAEQLGFVKAPSSGGKFKQSSAYSISANTRDLIVNAIDASQERLEARIGDLYA